MNVVLRKTSNYNMFELYDVNRTVHENTKDFRDLLQSMKEHGFLPAYPLHCVTNGSGRPKIKAGHNRLRAAQILGIPVFYVISDDNASIYQLEDAGPGEWKIYDYHVSYFKQGYESYIALDDYMKETGITIQNAAPMFMGSLAGSGNYRERFKRGEFKIKDYEHPMVVGDIVIFLKNMGKSWARDSNMVKAISRCVKVPEFDVNRFKDKCKAHIHFLEKQKNLDNYVKMIEEIYNYKAKKAQRLNVAFIASELAYNRRVDVMNKPQEHQQ